MTHYKITLNSWFNLYHDFPSCLLKVKIRDRRAISTTNCEQTVTKPPALQRNINEKMAELAKGHISRVFVRPSGTEDIVRVYAESEKQEIAADIALEVARLVFDQVGGVGNRP